MNDDVKNVLEKYFTDIKNNDPLQQRISNDDGVVIFLLKTSMAVEQEREQSTLPQKQREMLFSAATMLKIYDDIIKPASETFVNTINNMDDNTEKLMEVVENPLYQNSFVYVGNDNIQKGLSVDEITQLRHTGSLSSISPILEQTEKFYNEMSAQAHFNYTNKIDYNFSQKSEKEQQAIHSYINEHPKEIMALSFIAEATRNAGDNVTIYNQSDLAAKCEIDEVKYLASKFSYIDRNNSLEQYSGNAQPIKELDKPLGISREMKSIPSKNSSRSA